MDSIDTAKPPKPPRKTSRERKAEQRAGWRVWKPSNKPFLSDGKGGYVTDDGSARKEARAAMLARRAERRKAGA